MTNIRVDFKSLLATMFLALSAYVLFRAGQGSLIEGIIEVMFITLITICLYFSYRLILVVNNTTE
ncbi:hypothetical protein [Methanocella sp. MCL-LM]|uniref:hypothetical protein n=1 Tax=Methanocella sp. MCL-LM TaxID=3412035 RepID=UPI003C773291